MKKASELINHLKRHVIKEDEQRDELATYLDEAKKEWDVANEYFQQVTDPDLIDYAIYRMEAAERKYMYFFDQVRQRNKEENSTGEEGF